MEELSKWRQEQYRVLWQKFSTETFSWDEAARILDAPQGTVADLLSSLEQAGYLHREVDPIDKRIRSYRLVSVARARELNKQLETWRLNVSQNAPSLPEVIDNLWARCRTVLGSEVDVSATPQRIGQLILQRAAGKAKTNALRVVKKVRLDQLDRSEREYVKEILKLFDASHNAYRSISNVLLEYEKLNQALENGLYDLAVGDYIAVDGVPLESPGQVSSKSLCPICRRFEQSQKALALITGNPKMDSVFQTYRRSQTRRVSMRVCDYCFTAGWVDLPTSSITKIGQSINKEREYLFITTPLARKDLKRLLDFVAKSGRPQVEEVQEEEERESEHESLQVFNQFLREKYGVESFDHLAVLGLSSKRLQELRGVVLPSANTLQRVVAIRVPVKRLVGEDKISGAVRRELVKATMYDFWQITGGSMHYNRIVEDVTFSVNGQPIDLESMRRANIAYRIADRYARVGKYRQLDSGVFMLLLSRPREAINRILRAKRRERRGRYAPGYQKTEEVIDMAEDLVQSEDWKFQLGLRIVELLVSMDLAPRARSFWHKDKSTGEFRPYSGVDLVKWIQRIKMVHDPDSARAWGTSLINGYRRQHKGQGPNTEIVNRILNLVEKIIETCQERDYPLREFARHIANMDYYLLFYYNQRQSAQNSATSKDKEE